MMRKTMLFVALVAAIYLPNLSAKAAPSFIVGPAKNEISLQPGATKEVPILIVNKLDQDTKFNIFYSALITGQDGNLVPTKSTAQEKVSGATEVFLKLGQSQTINVSVTAAKNAEPGSDAFGIFVEPTQTNGGEIISHTQAGALVIVDIAGTAIRSGEFVSLKIADDKSVRMDNSLPLDISFSNTGDIHLNPYGVLVVKNIFGNEVSAQKIDPWYVMPKSNRDRNIVLDTSGFFGRYTASVSLNRGYNNLVDTKEVSFYVFPIWLPAVIAIILILIIFFLYKKGFFKGALVVALLLVAVVNVHAEMASGNYRVQFDSVNFGGGLSTSTNYTQESTLGEVSTGDSSSANYNMHAGYQQMNQVFLSLSTSTDVTLSPALGDISGGTANGSTTVTVATDSAAGYELYVSASSSPALSSGSDSFADYTPSGSVPDYSFNVGATQSFFGFSNESADAVSAFLNNGSQCGAGALNTTLTCWDGFATTTTLISKNGSANNPVGTQTTLNLRAGAGSSRNQQAGSYSADITFTALAL